MPTFYESAAGETLPASIAMRAGDVVKISACGLTDRGNEKVVRCVGPLARGLVTGSSSFAPAGQPNTILILAEGSGTTSITVLVGPEVRSSKPHALTISVASSSRAP